MKLNILSFLSISALLFLSCNDDPKIDRTSSSAISITVDTSTKFQTIAGFGGADGIFNQALNPNADEAEKAFGLGDHGLGLSIFRIKIPYNKSDWQGIVASALEAKKYDAKIIASPWSPPLELKSNNALVGGHLLEENYATYVDHLNDFVSFMADKGINIYAISIQNEPDIEVSYESCDWTASQMNNFIEQYGSQITGTKLMAPESFNFNKSYSNPILQNENAVDHLDIVAGHIYGSGLDAHPMAEAKGKEVWMTEYLMNKNATNSWSELSEAVIWDETLAMVNSIHQAMEYNWNAYIWWYLKRYYSFIGEGDQGTTEGEILKRGVAFSHFSKHIRPGYTRVTLDEEKDTGLKMTAYEGDDKIVIVIINSSEDPVSSLAFSIDASDLATASSYTTTLTASSTFKEITLIEGAAKLSIPAESISTLILETK